MLTVYLGRIRLATVASDLCLQA